MDKVKVSNQMKQKVLQYENTKKRIYWKPVSAVAVMVLILALFVIPSPLSSRVNAYCEEVYYTLEELIYGQHAHVTEYTSQIQQTQTDGDLSVQLNEALLDGTHLILNYTVMSDIPRFYSIEEVNGETYEGYYDLDVQKITINGTSKEYSGLELSSEGFVTESTDAVTYPVGDELCLCDFKELLENPDELLNIEIDVNAVNLEDEDIRQYHFAFTLENRELQLETKEIPFEHTLTQGEVTIQFEKICINSYSQKIYFHVTGLKDEGFDICETPETRNDYSFSLEGIDDSGNEVFGTMEEVKDGYGYFLIRAYSDVEGLNPDVKYYDMQMDYIWDDPEHLVGTDEEEDTFYGEDGNVGKSFRIECEGK